MSAKVDTTLSHYILCVLVTQASATATLHYRRNAAFSSRAHNHTLTLRSRQLYPLLGFTFTGTSRLLNPAYQSSSLLVLYVSLLTGAACSYDHHFIRDNCFSSLTVLPWKSGTGGISPSDEMITQCGGLNDHEAAEAADVAADEVEIQAPFVAYTTLESDAAEASRSA